jgi:hypothetical protein
VIFQPDLTYVDITKQMLMLIMTNCPQLMTIEDNVFGTIYKKSEKTNKFVKIGRSRRCWVYVGDEALDN